MRKNLFFTIFGVTFLFLLTFNNTFSQTINKIGNFLAENTTFKKRFVVDSVALFSFIEDKENEKKIEVYFEKKNMPLSKHAATFVAVAKKYNLDPFLLPTISIKESTGGKFLFKSFNPFGFGQNRFDNFDEAIEYVGDKLANGKYYKGKTLEKKLRTYNSVQKKYISEAFSIMKTLDNQKIEKINPLQYIDSFKVEITNVPEKEVM